MKKLFMKAIDLGYIQPDDMEKRFDKKFGHDKGCEYQWWKCSCSRFMRLTVENIITFITAWCECGDALETKPSVPSPSGKGTKTDMSEELKKIWTIVPILNKQGMIVDYKYYCFGCDKTYKLERIDTLK